MESCIGTSPLLLPVSCKRSQSQAHVKHNGPNIVGMQPLPYNVRKGELQIAIFQRPSPRIRCAAALNATCTAAGATQTVARNARTITVIPDKVKSPKIDDNGPGFPPRDDDGNGGNGGGGGKWSGGLVLLGILGVLDILKDIEGEWQRKDKRFHRA
ncbi:protein YELLOW LEAF 1, choloroplastic-like [Gastrolobium bilobum]|uniref:protein YELLOW LEAF 1, choloroplastic-like n=1 Tax=Gastrolobium bilobum TaxID=150636 RepID=UPI002AB1AEDF|nr:protein YELLOW LEAF 1, choloroplastic-like [Gastrolobium bilobum]